MICECGVALIKRRGPGAYACPVCRPTTSANYKLLRKQLGITSIIVTGESFKGSEKLHHKCKVCKSEFEATPVAMSARFKHGFDPCLKCDKSRQTKKMSTSLKKQYAEGKMEHIKKKRAISFTEYQEFLAKKNIRCLEHEFIVGESSVGSHRHECLTCGFVFTNNSYNMLKGNGCGRCSGQSKKTTSLYLEQLYALPDNKYEVCEEYKGARTAITHRCTTCKGERVVTPDNMLRKFYFKCPTCSPAVGGYKTYTYKLGDREVLLQGYEKFALDFITTKVEPHEVEVSKSGNVPSIRYNRKGKRSHRPDIFIPKFNRLIEVKSLYTLGLTKGCPGGCAKWRDMCAKYNAAVRQGFKYTLMVFNANGARVKLPHNWFELSFRHIKRHLYG